MKLVSYLKEDHAQLAILVNDLLYDMDILHPDLPVTMTMFLNYWEDVFPIAHSINRSLVEGPTRYRGIPVEDVEILAPVPNPTSCRDAYAFRQHVETIASPALAKLPVCRIILINLILNWKLP